MGTPRRSCGPRCWRREACWPSRRARPCVADGAGGAIHDELALAERRQREALTIYLSGDNSLDTAFGRLLLLATLLRQASAGEPIDRAEADALVADATEVFDRLGDDYGSALIRATDAIMAVAHGEIDAAAAAVDAARPCTPSATPSASR